MTNLEPVAHDRRMVRKAYKRPDPIPPALVQPEPQVVVAGNAGLAPIFLANAMVAELIGPALKLPNADAYWEFWEENCDTFSGHLRSLSALNDAAVVATGRPALSGAEARATFISECLEAAERLQGRHARSHISEAFADTLAAYSLVASFESKQALEDDREDQENAVDYNSLLKMLDAFLVCLLESSRLEVEPTLAESVVFFPCVTAELLLDAARKGAEKRNVASLFELDWVLPAWPKPSLEFLEYLEKRAPSLVDPHLRKICQGFGELSTAIADARDGRAIAPACSLETQGEFADVEPAENLESWASRLAKDLVLHRG